MSDITVRKVKFEFPDDLGDVLPGEDPVAETYQVAFSLTLPHLEPYLIRVYRRAVELVTDEALADDMRAFIGQEAQHHRNHHRANEMIKAQLAPEVAAQLQAAEDDLAADYRRYTDRMSLRFNLVYAEGFEAMTCAAAMTGFAQAEARGGPPTRFGPWQQLWAWHGAEEIEHRTVAFEAYEHLIGGYPYRVLGSIRSQLHFQRYIDRMQKVLLAAQGLPRRPHLPPAIRTDPKRYLRTYLPSYHPRQIVPGPMVDLVLQVTPTTD